MMPQPKYLILWNPSARSAEVSIDLRNQLEANPDVDLRITACAGEAEQLVEEAAEHEDGVVVAAGGDGTIHVVINTVCTGDRRPILSCLPLGTGNDLCRTLGIPLDLVEAADLVLNQPHPPIRAIDLVRAESQAGIIRFANVCSGGNSQRVSECLDEETKRRWGAWSYLRGAVEVLNDLEGFEVGLRFDRGPRETMRLWNVIVANGKTAAGGLPVAPRADIADGLMDVVLVRDGPPLNVAALSLQFFLGDYLEDDRVVFRRAREVEIDSSPPMQFVADGETIATTPVVFALESRAVRMICGK